MPVGEDPERAHDPERDARARAHDDREQELAPDVAEDGPLHACRVVVVRRAVARRHDPAHRRAYPLAVEQHVDGQHDDQDQRDRALDERREGLARERDELARALGERAPSVSSAVSPWRWTWMSMPFGPASPAGPQLRVGVVDDPGNGVGELETWSATGFASSAAIPPTTTIRREEDAQHRQPAREARALEHRHERVEQQRDERRDDEDEDDRTGRLEQQVRADDRQREHTAWIQRGTTTGGTGRGRQRIAGAAARPAGVERLTLDAARADSVSRPSPMVQVFQRTDGALASPA